MKAFPLFYYMEEHVQGKIAYIERALRSATYMGKMLSVLIKAK